MDNNYTTTEALDAAGTTAIASVLGTGCSDYHKELISLFDNGSCYNTSKFIINTVIAGILCLLGFAGNAVSFAVLRKDKQTPLASLLLQALAVADNFFLICWFVHFSVKDLLMFCGVKQYTNFFWEHMKTYTYPLVYIGQTATIWLTVFVAFTRYFAVCRPYSASRICNIPTVRYCIIIICIVSVVYNFPRFFEYKMIHKTVCGKDFYLPDRTILTKSKLYGKLYSDSLYYIFSFVLPLLLLAVLNFKLIIAYRQVQKRRAAMRGSRTERNGESHRDPNITLVMIIVVLVFMLCNLPGRVVQIIWSYDIKLDCKISHQFLFMELSTLLEVLNSSTNFIVYCVFRHQFREILKHKLCHCGQQRYQQADNMATQTNVNGVTTKTIDTQCPETHL